MRQVKYMLTVMLASFCLLFAALPAVPVWAAALQQTVGAADEAPGNGTDVLDAADDKAAEAAESEESDSEEENAMFLIFMGGALLIITVAVVAAVSTVSSSIAVAANMDVDGE